MVSPAQPAYCDWRMVGVTKLVLIPTWDGAPSRKAAHELYRAPYCESAGPFADIVAPVPKYAVPFGPNVEPNIVSLKPSTRNRRMSTPNRTLCMPLCSAQSQTKLKLLSTPRWGT